MADNTEVIVDLEVAPSQAVREINRVATAITAAINEARSLEGLLNKLSPAKLQAMRNTARELGGGSPDTFMKTASMQGALAKIRTDPALQLLKVEKATNETLSARRKLYEDIRKALPPEATTGHAQIAYRAGLAQLGGMPAKGTEDYKKFLSDTRNQVRTFDALRLADQAKVDAATLAADSRLLISREHLDAAAMDRTRQRKQKARADDLAADVKARAAYERADAVSQNKRRDSDAKAFSLYDYNNAVGMNKKFDADAKKPKSSSDVTRERAGRLGEYAVLGAGLGALLSTLGFAGKSTIEMESALKKLQAITQSTDIEMSSLEKTIYGVGQHSSFSAKEIADAATVMGQAGYSVAQVAEALPAIAALATGAGASMADAVGIVTSILAVFDLSVERSANVSNMLAQALNGSKLELGQLTLGIQYAGNIAAEGGVSFEELTAALGAMAKAGIKSGSTLGTGLRSLIEQLEHPTAKLSAALLKAGLSMDDIDIKSQGLYGVMSNLQNSSFKAADGMSALDIRGRNAFAALSNNLPAMNALLESLDSTSAATDAAGTQMDTFTSQWNRMKNAITGDTAVMGAPFLNFLKQGVGGIATMLTWLGQVPGVLPALSILLTLLGSIALAAAGGWAIGLVGSFLSIGVAAEAGAAGVGILGTTLAFLTGPVGLAGMAIAALALILGVHSLAQAKSNQEIEKAQGAAHVATAAMDMYQSRIAEVGNYVDMLTNRHERLSTGVNGATQEADIASRKFGAWGLELDKSGGKVDDLIRRLINLKGELAALDVGASTDRINALGTERIALSKQFKNTASGAVGNLTGNGSLGDTINRRNVLDTVGASPLLEKLKAGPLSLTDATTLASMLRQVDGKLDPQGKKYSAQVQGVLNGVNNQLGRNSRDTSLEQNNLGMKTISALPQGIAVSQEASRLQVQYNTRLATINKEKDPNKKQDMLVQLRSDYAGINAGFQSQMGVQARSMLKDPNVATAANAAGAASGKSPEQVVIDQLRSTIPAINNLAFAGGKTSTDTNPVVLRAQQKTLETQMRGAKKNAPLYKELKAQRDDISKRRIEAENPDSDVMTVQALIDADQGNSDATGANALAGGGRAGDKASRQSAKTLGLQVKDLERQITVAGANSAGQDVLKSLLAKWKATSEDQIRKEAAGSGASGEDLADRLDAFKSDAAKYAAEVLKGNLAAAAKLLADAADRNASEATGSISNALRANGGDLGTALATIQDKTNAALVAALAASDAEFAKTDVAASSPDAVEARRKITEDYAGKLINYTTKAIDALLQGDVERQQRQLQVRQSSINSQRAGISALSNSYGNRNLSDVQRYLGGVAGERLDKLQTGVDLNSAENDNRNANTKLSSMKGILGGMSEGASKDAYAASVRDAQIAAEKTQLALEAAGYAFHAMNDEAPNFASFGEAATAAWAAFADQAQITKPLMSQIADGLNSTFHSARDGLAGLISDTLSGAKSMKDAFKDMARSILGSLMDMIAKIIANKLLTWGITMLASAFGGGAGSGTAGMADVPLMAAQGSYTPIKRMAGGGMVTGGIPNRDSTHILGMPGEMMMNKSAVDMIGPDKLAALNAAGNRRMSVMPSVGEVVQRPKDEVNVWVVPPATKPPMTKNDIVAAITDDMSTGGATKRLVKQIVAGAI